MICFKKEVYRDRQPPVLFFLNIIKSLNGPSPHVNSVSRFILMKSSKWMTRILLFRNLLFYARTVYWFTKKKVRFFWMYFIVSRCEKDEKRAIKKRILCACRCCSLKPFVIVCIGHWTVKNDSRSFYGFVAFHVK